MKTLCNSVPIAAMAIILAVMGAAQAQQKPLGFSVAIHSTRDTFNVGTPVVLAVRLTNISDSTVTVPMRQGHPFWLSSIQITDGEGKSVVKKPTEHSGMWGGPSVFLAPGKSTENVITVPDFFDLSRPGTYHIELKFGGGSRARLNPMRLRLG